MPPRNVSKTDLNVRETVLDKRELVKYWAKELGSGAYGLTWKIRFAEFPADNGQQQNNPSPETLPFAAIKILIEPTSERIPGVHPRKDFMEEIRFLRKLRHPGVLRILQYGTCSVPFKIPTGRNTHYDTVYHISEFEDGTDTLAKLIARSRYPAKPDRTLGLHFLASLIEKVLAPLAYCHSRNVLHGDLHPGNILITTRKTGDTLDCEHAVLIDFGKAKWIYKIPDEENDGKYTTVAGGRFEYKHPDLYRYLRKNKTYRNMFKGKNCQRFDLFSVAVGFKEVFALLPEDQCASKRGQLISRIIERLHNKGSHVDYPIERALAALRRAVAPDFGDSPILLRLSGGANSEIDRSFLKVIDTPEFQRLRGVAQLSLAHYVYPSATHSRFSHCIGAFHLCGEYLEQLNRNSPEFRLSFDSDMIRMAKLAALLHDLGHYPNAHYFEEFGHLGNDCPEFHHQYYTNRLLEGTLPPKGAKQLQAVLKKEFGTDYLGDLKRIRTKPPIKEILNGAIDCDKVDYLRRDGLASGVPYAASVDLPRFLSSLTCEPHENGEMTLEITPKGVAPVESILNARYHLFSEVYWHKTCRAMVAMVKYAMFLVVDGGAIRHRAMDTIVLTHDDRTFLQWLFETLSKTQPQPAKALIKDPFISGQRKIYKRIMTLSSIWDSHPFNTLQDCAGSYRTTVDFQNYLVEQLNDYGRDELRRHWSPLANHELLLDIPPKKDITDFPDVYYAKDSKGKHHYEFKEVSAAFRHDELGLLERARRIRVFVHPNRAASVLGLPRLGQTLRKMIVDWPEHRPIQVNARRRAK